MAEQVRLTLERNETLARIVLDSPKGNVLTTTMVERVSAELAKLEELRSVRLLTLEGGGPHFSFGASISEHAPGQVERMLPAMHQMIRDLLDVPVPTAAVVQGRCLGGGFELALACDFIFAADDAVIGVPEVALAAFPPAAAALLPPRLGYARATDAILTGATRPAAEWEQAGLVTRVVPRDRLDAEVGAWFDEHLAGRSASGLRHAAAAARFGLRKHVARVLPDLERLYLNELMRTPDVTEAVTAFLAKRPPVWTD
ncbi:MAG: enoyl-CoA hydratase/isomerase family protein [Vicinamibacterales bacterium]|nr:enoyl-CoA hydratase/isomerase family protein [Vicinamibacterales bacterium]MDP6610151.1 enoyl-CoA hydratase/isomerase family protein [Vicinamibacterales bacterium]MDP7472903.1 enoyl-CoA hydratase/isomerase family protein [Vicinamibacterales bacterium]